MTDLELGWLAGIIDGEGCLAILRTGCGPNDIHRRTPHYRISITVIMGHRPTVERIKALVGVGTIITKKMSAYKANWSDAYMWRCSDRQAINLLAMLKPHLFTKSEEANIATQFANLAVTKFCKGGVPPEIQAERIRLYHLLQDVKPRNIAAKRASTIVSNS